MHNGVVVDGGEQVEVSKRRERKDRKCDHHVFAYTSKRRVRSSSLSSQCLVSTPLSFAQIIIHSFLGSRWFQAIVAILALTQSVVAVTVTRRGCARWLGHSVPHVDSEKDGGSGSRVVA